MYKKLLFGVLCSLSFNCANAYEQEIVYDYNNYPIYAFDIYSKGEAVDEDGELKGAFDIPASYTNPLFVSAKDWADVLNVKPKSLVEYIVVAYNEYNASAMSEYVDVIGNDKKITWVNAALNNIKLANEDEDKDSIPVPGVIMLGLGISKEHAGWQPYSGKHSLYHGELPELNTVMEHEIMHSLGLSSGAQQYREDYGDETYYFTASKNDKLSNYDANLRIYKGSMYEAFDTSKEMKPEAGMAVGKNEEFDVYSYSPYFIGENTIKVLGNKDNYDEARQAIIDNGGLVNYSCAYNGNEYSHVYGLPIHPADALYDDEVDLSHIELRNSFMSHQDYRNWLVPMEAELAVLQDLGYNINIRKYFGKSYYLNGITDTYTAGFSEWDGAYTGTPSTTEQGVGIHIYGNNNNITQASDILTKGEGSFGVRIDGVGNTYKLKSGNKINADGIENIALGITFGKNHKLNVESGSTVTAKGEDGIAASFDFGTNIFGIYQDQMGSYFRYNSSFEMTAGPRDYNNDALVDEFNISGTLEGKKAAIYIADNAHVKNINIKDNAQINGDIISEWNSVRSGYNSEILKPDPYSSYGWVPVNKNNPDEIYYTNLNFDNTFTGSVNGKITGENEIFNTLKMNNKGDFTYSGEEINVYSLQNTGKIKFANTENEVDLETQTGEITGNGELNIDSNVGVNVEVNHIANTINQSNNSIFSTINDDEDVISINKLNSDEGKLSFDLGDKFVLQNASDISKNKAKIGQIKVSEKKAEIIDEQYSLPLFVDSGNTMNLGTSKANVYYDGDKYTISQDPDNSERLIVKQTGTNVELANAANDETTANYIVTENKLTKNAGTVKGDIFDISGKKINVNGHKGLVINGNNNKNGTSLQTSIYGAKDSNLTVENKGKLLIDSESKNIEIGKNNETAIKMNKGMVVLDATKNKISINGSIKGTNPQNDNIVMEGSDVTLNKTSNVSVKARVDNLNLNNTSTNTNWDIINTRLNVKNDNYLSSNGTNSLILDNSILNLKNDKATDIKLAKLELKSDINANIDVDLETLKSDKFVLKNSEDFKANSFAISLENVNIINPNAILSKERYEIPFASKKYHTESLIGSVYANANTELMSPIFKYNMMFDNNKDMAGFILSRGSSSDYKNYNPSIFVAPVAAQIGGYLTQLNSYDQAFNNLDMKMMMTREERLAYKMANLYASETRPLGYNDVNLPEKNKAGWFRPYTAIDKVKLNNGPSVKNIMYGSFFGFDTDMFESANGWDSQYSVYFGYNGSHQKYSGNSMYQNGGSMGASGIWYKGNFFTGLTANVGASIADASTMYGSEDFPMLMTGIASKTGYNWELAKGKFIIQPSYLMSYSFVNAFDYTNAAGVRISSDPLHAINITPGIKFIGNLKNGWQPYAGVQMVWNIMDKTHFKAQNVSLPELSVKPYVQYGVGVQKRWGERFTGYVETMVRNAGRNGVAFNVGFRWTLGK